MRTGSVAAFGAVTAAWICGCRMVTIGRVAAAAAITVTLHYLRAEWVRSGAPSKVSDCHWARAPDRSCD